MATPSADATLAPSLELDAAEILLLEGELPLFVQTLVDPLTRARYQELAADVAAGTVPSDRVPSLEALLELLLSSGRARREHGPEAEAALLRLFARTPRGAALKAAAQEVNEALTALRGQPLERLAFTPTARGHSLVIETASCQLALAIERAGVRVERLETGG